MSTVSISILSSLEWSSYVGGFDGNMDGRVQGWAWVASTDVDQRYPEADTRQEAVEACIAGALLNDSQTIVTNNT